MRAALDGLPAFIATHARALDRRRYELWTGAGDIDATRAALNAYRNPDGGYGSGLEPDLRAVESQPVAAMHAFEVLAEMGPASFPESVALCEWLASVALDDGGLTFALPLADPAGCAPFWAGADHSTSSLHITAAVTGYAWKVARHDPGVAAHPWLERSTRYCMRAIATSEEPGHALELMYVLRFLDAVMDREPEAGPQLERLGRFIPESGVLPVAGGLEDEVLRPLDLAPEPGSPARTLFDASAIEKDLDRLEQSRAEDGGWPLGWQAYSPAAAVEWRGYLTIAALSVLRANGRL